MDKIEIWANRRGEKLVPWARNALIRQAREEKAHETFAHTGDIAALEAVAILREIASPDAVKRARAKVTEYINNVEGSVKNDFS